MENIVDSNNAKIRTFEILNKLTGIELRSLLVEIKKISDSDIPSKCRMSPGMKLLFKNEKTDYNHWGDQFQSVRSNIESECLHRLRNARI